MMASVRRPRSVANLAVDGNAYIEALQDWLMSPPVVPVRSRIGTMVAECRAVSPAAAEACLPAVEELIAAGLRSGVAQPSKLEFAMKRVLASCPALLGSDRDPDLLSHQVANHLQAVLAMIRYIRAEDSNISLSARRYAKTGGLRKAMSSRQWSLLHPTLQSFGSVAINRDWRG